MDGPLQRFKSVLVEDGVKECQAFSRINPRPASAFLPSVTPPPPMKTNDLKELSPLEKVTLPTAAMPGRMDSLGRPKGKMPPIIS